MELANVKVWKKWVQHISWCQPTSFDFRDKKTFRLHAEEQ